MWLGGLISLAMLASAKPKQKLPEMNPTMLTLGVILAATLWPVILMIRIIRSWFWPSDNEPPTKTFYSAGL
jgi:hypothetical protein